MRHNALRPLLAVAVALGLGSTLTPTLAAQPSVATESEDSATARANAEQEAIDNAAEAAATPAPGREDLEPAEPGFDDNTIDNDAGADWHPTTDPEATITPGQMRSDTEDIPGGFTKEEADRAEVQEAAEQQAQQDRATNPLARALAAAPVNCTTYWPSPYKVCGAIREKYDASAGPPASSPGPSPMSSESPTGSGGVTSSSTGSSTGTPPPAHTLPQETFFFNGDTQDTKGDHGDTRQVTQYSKKMVGIARR